MKKLSILFLSLISALFLYTSCMDDEDPVMYMFVTVVDEGYLGHTQKKLICDKYGYILYPTANSLAQIGGLENVERAYLGFKLKEGGFVPNQKEYKDVELIGYGSIGINVKDFTEGIDTLRNDSLISFDQMWAYGGYLNVATTFVTAAGKPYIDIYQEGVSNDTLYLKFNFNFVYGNQLYRNLTSFRMPNRYEMEGVQPKGDSIVVAVAAKVMQTTGSSPTKIQYLYDKYKLED